MSTRTKSDKAAADDQEELAAEIGKLREDLSEMVETIARIGRERADSIAKSEPLAEGLRAGEAALSDLASELRTLETDIANSTRRSPWRALGIALGIGLVAGFLLRR